MRPGKVGKESETIYRMQMAYVSWLEQLFEKQLLLIVDKVPPHSTA